MSKQKSRGLVWWLLPASLLAQRRIIVSVASGWNCVQKLRSIRHACGPTALRASSWAFAGTVTTS